MNIYYDIILVTLSNYVT